MENNFFDKKRVVGMVHLQPMPSNASYKGNNEEIEQRALADAKTLMDNGVDAIMLENFSDWPQYSTEIPLESYSLMLNIATKIKMMIGDIPFGVNIEMNAWKQEWLMAYAVGADFIRVEAFVDNRAGSFGMIEACSTQMMDLMKQFPAKTKLFTDVHTAETYGFPNVPINELAQNAINHESSAIIVTENYNEEEITNAIKGIADELGVLRTEVNAILTEINESLTELITVEMSDLELQEYYRDLVAQVERINATIEEIKRTQIENYNTRVTTLQTEITTLITNNQERAEELNNLLSQIPNTITYTRGMDVKYLESIQYDLLVNISRQLNTIINSLVTITGEKTLYNETAATLNAELDEIEKSIE